MVGQILSGLGSLHIALGEQDRPPSLNRCGHSREGIGEVEPGGFEDRGWVAKLFGDIDRRIFVVPGDPLRDVAQSLERRVDVRAEGEVAVEDVRRVADREHPLDLRLHPGIEGGAQRCPGRNKEGSAHMGCQRSTGQGVREVVRAGQDHRLGGAVAWVLGLRDRDRDPDGVGAVDALDCQRFES